MLRLINLQIVDGELRRHTNGAFRASRIPSVDFSGTTAGGHMLRKALEGCLVLHQPLHCEQTTDPKG